CSANSVVNNSYQALLGAFDGLNHFNRQGGKNGGKKIKAGGNDYFRS
ncbi:unnamed protein product, partial [marine sediment metagenome]